MKTFRISSLLIALLLFSHAAFAGEDEPDQIEGLFKKHINNVVTEAKAAAEPGQKRAILNEGLEKLNRAIDHVEASAQLSDEQQEALAGLRAGVQDKQDELNGVNGFSRVADANLDAFADYVQQDLEQAQRTLTITIGTTVLLLLLIILLVL